MKLVKMSIFSLKMNVKQIVGWSIGIFSIMFLYMILFPSVQEMADIKLEAMPKELIQFVGMDDFGEIGDFSVYFGMIYNLILIAISIFAAVFAANLFKNEEKYKTIEYLYSHSVSRFEIFISKLITAFVAVLTVILAGLIATLICGFINGGDSFSSAKVLQIVKFTGVTPFLFMGIGVMISAISGKISGSSIGSFSVILSYILGFVSGMVSENFQWLKYLSPFEVLSPDCILNSLDNEVLISMLIYFVVMSSFIIVGLYVYKRRDFNV